MNRKTIGRRTKLIIILSAALGLALPFYVVPNAIGNSFTSSSLKLVYLSTTAPVNAPTFKVLNENTAENVTGVTFSIIVSNSYFLPVVVSYQGHELVVFIYNSTVDRAGDAIFANKLVWRTTASADLADEDNVRFPNSEELVLHAVSIPPSGMQFDLADEETAWNGTDTRVHSIVGPGDYYVYALALGRLSPPVLVRIIS